MTYIVLMLIAIFHLACFAAVVEIVARAPELSWDE